MSTLIEVKGITKKFPGVVALNDISFSVNAGEVHILLGENGAGKSTLMKILSGVYEPTEGEIIIEGKNYAKLTPKESFQMGISIIYQELSLVEQLSIVENIFMGKLLTKKVAGVSVVDKGEMVRRTEDLLTQLGLKRDSRTLVSELSISEKQVVEIAKALAFNAKVIIMDEPTSSLTSEEVDRLFVIIRKLRQEGKGIVYISHKMEEIKKIGDRVSVLKDGNFVGTRMAKDVELDELIRMMVGREVNQRFNSTKTPEELKARVAFEAKHLTRKDHKVKDVSFQVYEGEILGFAGLVGSGRTELMEAIFGAAPLETGELYLNDKKIKNKNSYQTIKQNIGLLTENRRSTGFFHNFTIEQNTVFISSIKQSGLGGISGLINTKNDTQIAEQQKEKFRIKCRSVKQNITELSGGNQQKVIVGKWVASNAELLIFDEPTRGIDIGSKSDIYRIMRDLADQGKVIIMVSSEMPELFSVCDRIAVFREGRINKILDIAEASEEAVLAAAMSH